MLPHPDPRVCLRWDQGIRTTRRPAHGRTGQWASCVNAHLHRPGVETAQHAAVAPSPPRARAARPSACWRRFRASATWPPARLRGCCGRSCRRRRRSSTRPPGWRSPWPPSRDSGSAPGRRVLDRGPPPSIHSPSGMSRAIALAPRLDERPSSSELAALFRGLADPARLAILRRLVDGGPQTVSGLVAACRQRQPSVSKHLACLHDCGLVARERRGRQVVYCALAPELPSLMAAAEGLWEIARCGESCTCSCCQEGGER
jgi:ArsR family transcriptional regulator, cadmium/lead-responsive transcriptional repressor